MNAATLSLLPPDELGSREIAAWQDIIERHPAFWSPYFSPHFACRVGRARRDTLVAVWRQAGDYVGFLPFHRRRMATGMPISGMMSDYHAVIAEADFRPDAEQILSDCRLDAFDFQNWLAAHTPTGAVVRESGPAPYLDLSPGYKAYTEQRRQAGVGELKKTEKKARKLEREVGPLRLLPQTDDERILQALYRWKGEQYRRTTEYNAFTLRWVTETLEAILAARAPHFQGALSALYAGDELVAVHMGMRTDKVWHYWFPTHNPDFGRYSPGMILALRTAEHAAGIGIQRLELGKGTTRFKQALGNGEVELQAGYMGCGGTATQIRRARYAIEDGAEALPLGRFSSWPRRLFKRLERRLDRRY